MSIQIDIFYVQDFVIFLTAAINSTKYVWNTTCTCYKYTCRYIELFKGSTVDINN